MVEVGHKKRSCEEVREPVVVTHTGTTGAYRQDRLSQIGAFFGARSSSLAAPIKQIKRRSAEAGEGMLWFGFYVYC